MPTPVDTEAYEAAVDAIYACAQDPNAWPDALAAIAGAFGDVGAILVFPRENGEFGTIVSPGLEAAKIDFESSEWRDKDLRFMRAMARGYFDTGEPLTDRHVVTPAEVESHPFYAELLRRHGLKWFAGIKISPAPSIAAAVSIQRSGAKPEFSEPELEMVKRLGRHVERALSLSVRLVGVEMRLLAGASAFAARLAEATPGRAAVAIEKLGVPAGDLSILLRRLAGG